ncbi:uncharacterized protein LOC144107180 [Amblyomma americanum]
MTAANDTAGQAQPEVAAADAARTGDRTTVADWLKEKKVLPRWVWIGLSVLMVTVVAIAVAAYFATQRSGVKVYLGDYEEIAFYEITRPPPYLTLTKVEKEECAKKCSTEVKFNCEFIQFCAAEGEALGVCDLFTGNDLGLRSVHSDNCTIFTRGDPAQFHIPHGGASPLNKGLFATLIYLAAFKFLVT